MGVGSSSPLLQDLPTGWSSQKTEDAWVYSYDGTTIFSTPVSEIALDRPLVGNVKNAEVIAAVDFVTKCASDKNDNEDVLVSALKVLTTRFYKFFVKPQDLLQLLQNTTPEIARKRAKAIFLGLGASPTHQKLFRGLAAKFLPTETVDANTEKVLAQLAAIQPKSAPKPPAPKPPAPEPPAPKAKEPSRAMQVVAGMLYDAMTTKQPTFMGGKVTDSEAIREAMKQLREATQTIEDISREQTKLSPTAVLVDECPAGLVECDYGIMEQLGDSCPDVDNVAFMTNNGICVSKESMIERHGNAHTVDELLRDVQGKLFKMIDELRVTDFEEYRKIVERLNARKAETTAATAADEEGGEDDSET